MSDGERLGELGRDWLTYFACNILHSEPISMKLYVETRETFFCLHYKNYHEMFLQFLENIENECAYD